MAISSVSEITGNNRISSRRMAVNCNRRDGNTRSGSHPRSRQAWTDHAEMSESPSTSHTQLRRISKPVVIVIEAGR